MAKAITMVVILGFFGVAVSYLPRGGISSALATAALPLLALLLCLQMLHSFPSLLPRLSRHRYLTLGAQTLLTYLPFLAFGSAWLGMPGFLAASALLILRAPLSLIMVGAVMISVQVIHFLLGFSLAELAYSSVSTFLTCVVVYSLSKLSGLVTETHRSRAELAHLILIRERLRFARDLHDLLGYSLSSLTLQCELASRLISTHPERAQRELAEALESARGALADVRSVAEGLRTMSLDSEVASAGSILEAADIRAVVSMDVPEESLTDRSETVLAIVLREAVTNVLRHSRAKNCEIRIRASEGRVRLSVVNDGLVPRGFTLLGEERSDGGHHSGTGIGNLTVRVETLGGTLEAGPCDGGAYRLSAELPVVPRRSGEPRPERPAYVG
ncbi:two-component system sensor histidine kinase DesK [Nocardiopsis arvandica]|uniref:Two-component system sensor histidine kinase DesK n=1 Tax=Nocardiopsis sinuspersici TaxID=501010 RepID=A0A7Y9XGZ8_9ACTN|nr:histidine kinase [Nocardiopsis sinuspersici]NYH55657.1 two-component system sensor histidine kinase DesK [Nocardiopsis sinuspersici]